MPCGQSPKRMKKQRAYIQPLPSIEEFVVVQPANTEQDLTPAFPEPPNKVREVVHAIRSSALKSGKKYKISDSFLKDAQGLRLLDLRKERERHKRHQDREKDRQLELGKALLRPPHFFPLAPNPSVELLLQQEPGLTSQSSNQSPPPPPPLPPSHPLVLIPTAATFGTSYHSPPKYGTLPSQILQHSDAVPFPAALHGTSDTESLSPTTQSPTGNHQRYQNRRVRFGSGEMQ